MQESNLNAPIANGAAPSRLVAWMANLPRRAANALSPLLASSRFLARPALPSAWRQAQTEISLYPASHDQWDEGEYAPPRHVAERACAVLRQLAALIASPPQPNPTGHGEIMLCWELPNDGYFYVSVFDNRVVHDGRFPNGEYFFGRCDGAAARPNIAALTAFVRQHIDGNFAELGRDR